MSKRDEFERLILRRMEETGEDYGTAMRALSRQRIKPVGRRQERPHKPAPEVMYRRTRSNRPPPPTEQP